MDRKMPDSAGRLWPPWRGSTWGNACGPQVGKGPPLSGHLQGGSRAEAGPPASRRWLAYQRIWFCHALQPVERPSGVEQNTLPGGSTLQLKQGPSDASRSGPHRVGRTEAGRDVAGIDVDSRPCTAGCQASAGPASALHQSMTGCRMRPQAFRLLSMFSQKTAARTRALPVQPSGLKNSSQNSQTQMVLRMGSR